jgi:hypothetical protein
VKAKSTPAKMRRIARWGHEGVLDAKQRHCQVDALWSE